MVTGKPPRDNPSLRDALGHTPTLAPRLRMYRVAVKEAPKPEEHRRLPNMDRRLAQIIDQCLESDPKNRLRDGGAIVEALNRRVRARRYWPVFLFGLLAPLLLLLLMAAAAVGLGRSALNEAEDALVERQLKDNQVLAQLAASIIEARLDYRLGLLERFAGDPKLRKEMAAQAAQPGDIVEVQKRIEYIRRNLEDQQPASRDPDSLFFEIVLADRQGEIVAKYPPDETRNDSNWSWRGWFNGVEDKHADRKTHYPIGSQPHVSQPFIYRGKRGIEGGDKLVLALSVPVKEFKGEEVVGRLVGFMKVRELHNLIDSVQISQKDGTFVLVNEHRHLLYHGLHNDEVLNRVPFEHAPEPLPGGLSVFKGLNGQLTGGDAHFVDPLDHKEYLAGFAPLKTRDWRVIVQYNREETLQPSRHLARLMRYAGLVAASVAVLFVLGLYWLLQRTMRRAEKPAHA